MRFNRNEEAVWGDTIVQVVLPEPDGDDDVVIDFTPDESATYKVVNEASLQVPEWDVRVTTARRVPVQGELVVDRDGTIRFAGQAERTCRVITSVSVELVALP